METDQAMEDDYRKLADAPQEQLPGPSAIIVGLVPYPFDDLVEQIPSP